MSEYKFELKSADKQSHIYRKFLDHFKYCLQRDRKRNDGDLSPEQTQKLRGRIAFAKELIEICTAEILPPDEEGEEA